MSDRSETLSLMQTIQRDSELRDWLASQPADRKTVTLSVGGGSKQFSHPDRNETMLWHPPTHAADNGSEPDAGVPTRQLQNLHSDDRQAAEYRLVGQLGAGGTGVVYQAHQRAVDREVAIKTLRQEIATDPISRTRFLSEARVIGALDHPNVIALHELGVDQSGSLFYSMKRIDGTSWDKRIESMSVAANVKTLLQVADAIRYAHSQGFVHRDIKPENVMLGRFGEVLLADWGLALQPALPERLMMTEAAIGGTPAYMAPELARGSQVDVGFATDVYLLGAVLFQILTGEPPHDGTTLLDCLRGAAENRIRPTDDDSDLMEIAKHAMATDPSDRFQTVDEFTAAIEDDRVHQQSNALVRRAMNHVKQQSAQPNDESERYEGFRVADALLREAIAVWPENRRAAKEVVNLQLKFASVAAHHGDLDLAITLYDAAGKGDSSEAMSLRQYRDQRNANSTRVAKYSVLFTDSPEAGLLVRGTDGVIVEANPAFETLLGYSAELVVGESIQDLNVWVCSEGREYFVGQLKATGSIDNFEARFRRQDDSIIDVLISARQTVLGGTEMIVSNIRDISMRKAAETELKRSQQRLREFQHLAGLGTWTFDVASESVTWSEEAYRLAGRDPAAGTPSFEEYLQLVHPDDRERFETTVHQSIGQGAAFEIRLRQKASGSQDHYRNLIVRGQPILNEEGEVVEVYGVLIDTGKSV